MTLRTLLPKLTIPHFWVLATILSLFGYLILGYYDAQDSAARKLALRNAPPETVSVVDFQPARDVGLAREISVRAQVDTSFAMRRPMMLHGQGMQALIVPLLAPETIASAAADLIFGYVVVPLKRGESDSEALRRSLPEATAQGRYGPIVTLAGQRLQHTRLSGRIAKRITVWGRDAVRHGVMVMPFEGSREAALSQMPRSNFQQLCLWLAFASAAASVILLRAQGQIARDRQLARIDRHRSWSRDVKSPKAVSSFMPLIEQERLLLSGPDNNASGLSRWWRRSIAVRDR